MKSLGLLQEVNSDFFAPFLQIGEGDKPKI